MDPKARHIWVVTTNIRLIDHYEDINNPYCSTGLDKAMKEDTGQATQQDTETKLLLVAAEHNTP